MHAALGAEDAKILEFFHAYSASPAILAMQYVYMEVRADPTAFASFLEATLEAAAAPPTSPSLEASTASPTTS